MEGRKSGGSRSGSDEGRPAGGRLCGESWRMRREEGRRTRSLDLAFLGGGVVVVLGVEVFGRSELVRPLTWRSRAHCRRMWYRISERYQIPVCSNALLCSASEVEKTMCLLTRLGGWELSSNPMLGMQGAE